MVRYGVTFRIESLVLCINSKTIVLRRLEMQTLLLLKSFYLFKLLWLIISLFFLFFGGPPTTIICIHTLDPGAYAPFGDQLFSKRSHFGALTHDTAQQCIHAKKCAQSSKWTPGGRSPALSRNPSLRRSACHKVKTINELNSSQFSASAVSPQYCESPKCCL